MRPRFSLSSRRSFLGPLCMCALALTTGASLARAQYNPDGTPSMIPPNGDVFDAGVGQVSVPPPVPPPTYNGPAPVYQEGPDGQPTENFAIDCDPDIQNCVDPNADSQYDDGYDPAAYQQFQQALSPYGQWNEDPDYGEVWSPSADVVGNDFEPYATDGQWMASSDYGFTWVSDYDWGWAPFHYGRWVLGYMGWEWVPGTIWGPAWVDWRYGNGYCGWSPMQPRGVVVSAPSRSLAPSHPAWHFTLASEVTRRNPTYVPSQVVASVYKRTSPVNNARSVTINGVAARITMGPPVARISHDIGRAVPAMALHNSAPSALPRTSIVAKAGIALPQRPYVQRTPRAGTLQSVARPSAYGRAPQSVNPVRAYGNQNTVRSSTTSNGAVRSYNNDNYSQSVRSYSNYTPPAASQTMHESAPVYHQGYSAPEQTYRAPQQTYQAPQQTYSAPQQTYRAPQQTYTAPQQTYQAPQQTYRAPEPVYRAPEPSYHPAPAAAAPRSAPVFQSAGVHRR